MNGNILHLNSSIRLYGVYIPHEYDMFTAYMYREGGGAVGLGIALQAEGPRVRFQMT
jgi:hypothetical protein